MITAQQSPIDLRDPVRTDYGEGLLRIEWTGRVRGTVVRDGHDVKIIYGADARQRILLDGKTYHLAEMHFHHPAEHWVDGRQHTVEVHIVSQNAHDGTRVAFGIFIEAKGDDPDLNLEGDLHSIEVCEAPGSTGISTDPRIYLPSDVGHYYRYEGSLMTPGYEEDVSWVVFQDVARFPRRQVDRMVRLFGHPARLPQPLNRRFVLANFEDPLAQEVRELKSPGLEPPP